MNDKEWLRWHQSVLKSGSLPEYKLYSDKELSRQKRVMNFHIRSFFKGLLIGLVISIPIYILVVSVCVILGY